MRPLPIDPELPRIVDATRGGGLVLVAEPGAGKTTRVPRALLDAGFGERGEIVVVEPRRLAARMAATRVAEELGEPVGQRIGYQVRFDTKRSKRTRVSFVTEGILARRLDADPELAGVSAVVFDELHERHLDMDLALARARRARERGRELAIVAMSATLDAAPVAAFLEAPIVEVTGRTHPVEVRHAEAPDDRPLERRVRAALVRLIDGGLDGDVLVFLPGAREIRRALESCGGPAEAHGIDLLPLHGDLPAEAQDRAVRPGRRRKVVLSTNVAETSLTIDGVVAVIDSGLARVMRHSPWTGIGSLETAPISQASATQRAGRAGRTRPGVAVRLYTEREHAARPERDAPEIERAELSAAVLALRASGEDPEAFPYLEPPPDAALRAADGLLERLGAVEDGEVTPIGHAMLTLPAHPRIARLAIEAHRLGHTSSGAAVAALAQERDIRRASRTRFDGAGARNDEVASSDLLTRLDELEALGDRPNARAIRSAELDVRAVNAVLAASRQLERALKSVHLENTEEVWNEEAALLQATLVGFPDRLARRAGGERLLVAGGTTATLDASSAVKDAELLVVVDATQHRGGVRVRRASAVSVELVMERFLDALEDRTAVSFDPELERVFAHAELRYDGVLLERTRREPTGAEAAAVLAKAALSAGVHRFCDPPEALEALQRRLAFARKHDTSLPALDDARLERVLREVADGKRSFAELRSAGLLDWIRADLGASSLATLDRLAPTHVAIPARARVPVHYEVERPPWIESRLQDFFGSTETPTIADGREPLLLHLLAPNKRAAQITTDLAGFWERHYIEVRKELRRRYPKHSWPDDPLTAEPGSRRRRKKR